MRLFSRFPDIQAASSKQEDAPLHNPLILIPSYNPGRKVYETVAAARRQQVPVWIVVDGSTDGTIETLQSMATEDPDLRVIVLPRNQGKGAAILHGAGLALQAGYTHALTMDSDGQHPADKIPEFLAASRANADAMILGVPVFAADAPALRVHGRKISNAWANLETLGVGIGDSLFGFRVYPLQALHGVLSTHRWMRRFDFDPEVVVRLSWRGVKPVNLPAQVSYFRPEQGGVSHFHYVRDNVLLTWMHTRLFLEFLVRLPVLMARRFISGS
ncbi:glycosyltransferase family 2 protein [Candidatus Methylospira mobilis]|uniref:glycosyltransferase family 2 protein n=1 Tax=Candidatus Methylospira mobilis TaxID=1808979 RepID=UPI001D17A73E|nr:glycosyltransferase family 2 protein [Candidatus Methylospira mobilis]WNV05415.1 glycosyltransferase family 2 protein [Candidatus Methylospira mobilis]